MKATGIVRRADDLGRIIIPKQIREIFRIKDGDALEVYRDGACVVFEPVKDREGVRAITRRIDELGRVAIPIGVRETLGIRDGTPLEVYTTHEAVLMRKYEPEDTPLEKLGRSLDIALKRFRTFLDEFGLNGPDGQLIYNELENILSSIAKIDNNMTTIQIHKDQVEDLRGILEVAKDDAVDKVCHPHDYVEHPTEETEAKMIKEGDREIVVINDILNQL
jgi:AbrB family looped-hinge helix DNA binding protein